VLYRINLTNGSYVQVTPSLTLGGLIDIALVLQIGTSGLHGNNLTFANYLNNNAPFYTLELLALQPDIATALEIASPVRNAIPTFAAQTTQIAFGQLIADHFGQKRWAKAWQQRETAQATMAAESPRNQHRMIADLSLDAPIFADAPMEIQDQTAPSEEQATPTPSTLQQPMPCCPTSLPKCGIAYSPWISGFGEYSREHKQRQTPAFEAGSGGFLLASDFYGVYPELMLGTGIAYAHTHIHEDGGYGHANINQGAIVFYSEWTYHDYYFNMELWGSGYHTKNVRKINLPGVIGGSALSSTNGWQLTPHLEIGYDYKNDCWHSWLCIEPFTIIDWVANWEQGFHEHGAGKLNMGQKGRFCSLLRNEWGVRFYETLSYDWGTVTFREKGSYAYQKAFHTGTLTAFLIGSSGSFVVSTLNGAQNLGVIEFESLFVPRNKKYPYGSISYQGEFGSRYQSHQGMASIGLDF
jgi:Autotransporter beta-domain